MANKKPENQITPDSRKGMKPRGKSKRSLILDSIIEKGLLEVNTGASREEAEKAVFGFMAESAFNPSPDTAVVSNACLNHLMNKGWASVKPSAECIEYEFNENSKPHEQAAQILKGVSDGVIPPDIGSNMISSIASMLKITEVTELQDRIDALEAALNG